MPTGEALFFALFKVCRQEWIGNFKKGPSLLCWQKSCPEPQVILRCPLPALCLKPSVTYNTPPRAIRRSVCICLCVQVCVLGGWGNQFNYCLKKKAFMLHRFLPWLLIHTTASYLIRPVNLSGNPKLSLPFPWWHEP